MKTNKSSAVTGLALIGLCGPALAADPAAIGIDTRIKEVAGSYLQNRVADLPGKSTINITMPSQSQRLSSCTSLEAFQPDGAKRLGQTSIGVRCLAPATWSIYLSARVSVVGQYLAAASSLRPGQKLGANDLAIKTCDLGTLPEDVALTADQAINHTLAFGVLSGSPLRTGLLREAAAIQQGQAVKLVLKGNGFQVSTDATALTNATGGQIVKAKTAAGQVISGIANADGTVQLVF